MLAVVARLGTLAVGSPRQKKKTGPVRTKKKAGKKANRQITTTTTTMTAVVRGTVARK